jgi:diguanylate cyclase (GGDEF)-like protein/PAS domain S-box-containing protein
MNLSADALAKVHNPEEDDESTTGKWSMQSRLRLADSLFHNASEGVCITDLNQRILEVNPTLCKITGFERSILLGKTPRIFSSGLHDKEFYENIWRAIQQQGQWQGEVWNRHACGALYAVRLNISVGCDAHGDVSHYVGIMEDITQQKLHLEALEKNANIDPLTGLPNRLLFSDRLLQAISQADRTDTTLAICFLDLDHFKSINDLYGHQSGDTVLQQVAMRISSSLRNGDTIARLGGDEFVLLLWGMKQAEECPQILERIMQATCQPIALEHTVAFPAASIGVAMYPADAATADTLLALADMAMYRAKAQGGNRIVYHRQQA